MGRLACLCLSPDHDESIIEINGSSLFGIFMNRCCAKFNHQMGFELGLDRAVLSGYLKDKVGRKAWVRLRRRGLVASPAPPGSSLLTAVMGGGIENMRGGRLTIRGGQNIHDF